MTRTWSIFMLGLAACGGSQDGPPPIDCGPGDKCPAGLTCEAASRTCVHGGTVAIDAPPPAADAPPACEGGPVECDNLLANGGFEQPQNGLGDAYSVDPAYLPGWHLSAGGNQFFLEHGTPWGHARFTEGDQAICLNGDGAPNVYIEQTFPTQIGASYVLSFDMTDEQVAGPSACAVKVDVAGVTRTFDRSADTGFATKALTFVASATTTTLRLTDVTPGTAYYNNPLIDAVLVQPAR
jgi:hypothetical protein